jgi:exodeoxyribonuclease VII small subunit
LTPESGPATYPISKNKFANRLSESSYNDFLERSLPKFEDCLQQLERIVEQLERGDLPLEDSLKLFEEGMRLSGFCRKELESAEGKVEILLKQNGKLQAEPFEGAGEASNGRRSEQRNPEATLHSK